MMYTDKPVLYTQVIKHLRSEELGVGCHGVVVDLARALVEAVGERLVERAHLAKYEGREGEFYNIYDIRYTNIDTGTWHTLYLHG